MLGASCSLELPEWVVTKWRNPEETEDVMASDSSNEVSNSSVLSESVRMESSLVQSQKCLIQKGIILTPWFQGKVG